MSKTHKVLVTGASGMVGTRLCQRLLAPQLSNSFQPNVYHLVRREPRHPNEIYWDPYEMRIDQARLEGFDTVVHLAGENVGSGDGLLAFTGRWTTRKKHAIMESRRRGTALLSRALSSLKNPPSVLVAASGVGYYGDGGERELTEESQWGGDTGKPGKFLAEVAKVWEDETVPARDAGIRVVNTRFGVVLSPDGGALAKLLTPFKLGFGGPIGSGNQFMSWISMDDALRAIEFAIHTPTLQGPINVCSPNPVRNKVFTGALARAVRRPAFLPMPEQAVRMVFGEMGEETLLVSQKAVPQKLVDSGFTFQFPDIGAAFQHLISK